MRRVHSVPPLISKYHHEAEQLGSLTRCYPVGLITLFDEHADLTGERHAHHGYFGTMGDWVV
jgi:hypothetical protein